MSLQVSAHPPSDTYSQQTENKTQTIFIMTRFIRSGLCCYAEPQAGSDRWWITVEREESLRLRGYAITAKMLHPTTEAR